jgi:hypothetical protein
MVEQVVSEQQLPHTTIGRDIKRLACLPETVLVQQKTLSRWSFLGIFIRLCKPLRGPASQQLGLSVKSSS